VVTDPRQNPVTPLKCQFHIAATDVMHLSKEDDEARNRQCGEKAEWAIGDDLRFCHAHGQSLVRELPLQIARDLNLRLLTLP
jgi:hypothetical protein